MASHPGHTSCEAPHITRQMKSIPPEPRFPLLAIRGSWHGLRRVMWRPSESCPTGSGTRYWPPQLAGSAGAHRHSSPGLAAGTAISRPSDWRSIRASAGSFCVAGSGVIPDASMIGDRAGEIDPGRARSRLDRGDGSRGMRRLGHAITGLRCGCPGYRATSESGALAMIRSLIEGLLVQARSRDNSSSKGLSLKSHQLSVQRFMGSHLR